MTQPEVIAIFGRRGSGKTTRAKHLAVERARVVVFDPLGEWAGFHGYRRVDRIIPTANALHDGRAVKLAYVPHPSVDPMRAAHNLAVAIWMVQDRRRLPVTLIIDEANLAYPVSGLKREHWGLPACLLQGRHRQIALIAISQRPALVSLDLRANAHKSYWFAIAGQDRRAALQTLPAQEVERLARLPDHQFLLEDRGQVTAGTNGRATPGLKPPARSRRKTRKPASTRRAKAL